MKSALALSLALALGCSLPALADNNSAELSGTVMMKDGAQTSAAPGIKVTAESPAAGERSVTTDKGGHFFIAGLPVGTYMLTFSKPNAGAVSYRGINLTAAENRVVRFTLARQSDGLAPHLNIAHAGRTASLYVIRSESSQ